MHQDVVQLDIQDNSRLDLNSILNPLMFPAKINIAFRFLQQAEQPLCVSLADYFCPLGFWVERSVREKRAVCAGEGIEEGRVE